MFPFDDVIMSTLFYYWPIVLQSPLISGFSGQKACNTVRFHMGFQYHDYIVNALRPRQNERHFTDDIFKCIFLNENVWIPIKISLKFVPKSPINNIPALVQIMAWRRPGDKPLSESMMVSLPTHICVTRPQWVNKVWQLSVDIDTLSTLFCTNTDAYNWL